MQEADVHMHTIYDLFGLPSLLFSLVQRFSLLFADNSLRSNSLVRFN